MSKARGSSLRGWAALSAALIAAACQANVVVPTIAPTQTAPTQPAPSQPGPTQSAPTATSFIVRDPTPAPLQPIGETQEATVTYVVDGDTIHVDIGGQEFRVRYIGVDAPEIAHDGNPGERLGPEATQANAHLVANERVVLEKDTSDTDQFGRLLRYVWLPPTTANGAWLMVDEELAAEGMADVKRYPPDTHWQALLQQAEDNAREAGLGIWSAP